MSRVLVTGCPRSGTTFLGRVLATAPGVAYLHEPLNPDCGVPAARDRFADLDRPELAELAQQVEQLLELRGRLRGAVYPTDSRAVRLAKLVLKGRGPVNLAAARILRRHDHVLVKDPFAMNSIPWFEAHGCTTLLLVRHPAAVAASFRRLGWSTRAFVRRQEEQGALDRTESSWLDESDDELTSTAVYWRIQNRIALAGTGSGEVVVHERLSADPAATVARLRTVTGLPGSARSDRLVRTLTTGGTTVARPGGRTHQFRRASAGILDATLRTLRTDEIDRVWAITADIADRWYHESGVR